MAARNYTALTIHKETFNVDSRYTNLKYLGGGAYGSVCAADDTKTGRKVALKKCRDVFRHLDDAKRILREIKILQLMGTHENLLVGTRVPPCQSVLSSTRGTHSWLHFVTGRDSVYSSESACTKAW